MDKQTSKKKTIDNKNNKNNTIKKKSIKTKTNKHINKDTSHKKIKPYYFLTNAPKQCS